MANVKDWGKSGLTPGVKPHFPLLVFSLFAIAVLGGAQGKQTFSGRITDSMCPAADHSRMRMGSTDAECAIACADVHAASYVLYDGKDVYALSDQKTSEQFAGKKVTITGTLNAKTKTIQVDSISN